MAFELRSARFLAQDVLRAHLHEGCTAVDCTAGNGHDTCFLAQLCGEGGHVYAFDIQGSALLSAADLLQQNGLRYRVTLIRDGHEHILAHLSAPVDAVMFNLGWLPGGDKHITTLWDTTRTAVTDALTLLKRGGIMTVCVYPGHAEGNVERENLSTLLSALRPQEYNVLHGVFANAGPGAPECWVIQRQ